MIRLVLRTRKIGTITLKERPEYAKYEDVSPKTPTEATLFDEPTPEEPPKEEPPKEEPKPTESRAIVSIVRDGADTYLNVKAGSPEVTIEEIVQRGTEFINICGHLKTTHVIKEFLQNKYPELQIEIQKQTPEDNSWIRFNLSYGDQTAFLPTSGYIKVSR